MSFRIFEYRNFFKNKKKLCRLKIFSIVKFFFTSLTALRRLLTNNYVEYYQILIHCISLVFNNNSCLLRYSKILMVCKSICPMYSLNIYVQVGSGYGIHQLHLCKELRLPNECLGYDDKQSDGEALVILAFWGMRSTPSIAIAPRSTLALMVSLFNGISTLFRSFNVKVILLEEQ